MKTTKFLMLLLCGALMSLSFSSCGGDDDETTSGDDGNNSSSSVDGHEAVDMGLSVKWATCNVGASKAYERGKLYSWGCTTPLVEGNDGDNYNPYISGSTYTKYTMNGSNPDGKKVLESTDDAASVNWGSKWRTPTKAEMEELVNKCIWEYDYKNGVGGFTVKGPSGNTIFLPSGTEGAANVIEDTNEGEYWTSTLCWEEGWDGNVYTIFFNKPDYVVIYHSNREYGLFIRPVCSK